MNALPSNTAERAPSIFIAEDSDGNRNVLNSELNGALCSSASAFLTEKSFINLGVQEFGHMPTSLGPTMSETALNGIHRLFTALSRSRLSLHNAEPEVFTAVNANNDELVGSNQSHGSRDSEADGASRRSTVDSTQNDTVFSEDGNGSGREDGEKKREAHIDISMYRLPNLAETYLRRQMLAEALRRSTQTGKPTNIPRIVVANFSKPHLRGKNIEKSTENRGDSSEGAKEKGKGEKRKKRDVKVLNQRPMRFTAAPATDAKLKWKRFKATLGFGFAFRKMMNSSKPTTSSLSVGAMARTGSRLGSRVGSRVGSRAGSRSGSPKERSRRSSKAVSRRASGSAFKLSSMPSSRRTSTSMARLDHTPPLLAGFEISITDSSDMIPANRNDNSSTVAEFVMNITDADGDQRARSELDTESSSDPEHSVKSPNNNAQRAEQAPIIQVDSESEGDRPQGNQLSISRPMIRAVTPGGSLIQRVLMMKRLAELEKQSNTEAESTSLPEPIASISPSQDDLKGSAQQGMTAMAKDQPAIFTEKKPSLSFQAIQSDIKQLHLEGAGTPSGARGRSPITPTQASLPARQILISRRQGKQDSAISSNASLISRPVPPSTPPPPDRSAAVAAIFGDRKRRSRIKNRSPLSENPGDIQALAGSEVSLGPLGQTPLHQKQLAEADRIEVALAKAGIQVSRDAIRRAVVIPEEVVHVTLRPQRRASREGAIGARKAGPSMPWRASHSLAYGNRTSSQYSGSMSSRRHLSGSSRSFTYGDELADDDRGSYYGLYSSSDTVRSSVTGRFRRLSPGADDDDDEDDDDDSLEALTKTITASLFSSTRTPKERTRHSMASVNAKPSVLRNAESDDSPLDHIPPKTNTWWSNEEYRRMRREFEHRKRLRLEQKGIAMITRSLQLRMMNRKRAITAITEEGTAKKQESFRTYVYSRPSTADSATQSTKYSAETSVVTHLPSLVSAERKVTTPIPDYRSQVPTWFPSIATAGQVEHRRGATTASMPIFDSPTPVNSQRATRSAVTYEAVQKVHERSFSESTPTYMQSFAQRYRPL
ncbi:hypothetical protein BJ742DRAFT_910903 [Cladochytrium replicatum]|nr:hypothetical protein BJ742DRAFT_910903 [Cladochytrium replicatum]